MKFDVTPSDAVALVVVCDSEIVTELVADDVDIEYETFADTSDDDETEGGKLVEFGFKPREAVALALLCDSERAKALVVAGGVDIEDETFPDTSGDDETEGRILVEFDVMPRDAVALVVVCDSDIVTELVADGVDIECETFVDTSGDDETEGGILVEFRVMPRDVVALVVVCVALLCDSEIAKELVADGVDIEDETFTDTLDDDETEGRTVIEFGFKPRDAVTFAVLCDSEIAKELVVDGGVDIEDETFPDTSGDDEAEGRMLVKFDVTPRDAVTLVVVCDSEIVTELVADVVDIEYETFPDT